MKLNELMNQFESKRVIMYNAKGDKVIYHNKNVRQVSGNIYCGETIKEEYNDYCDLFILYDGISVGMWIGSVRTAYDLDEVIASVVRSKQDTLENFKAAIQSRVANNEYFQFTEIEFSKYIDPSFESQMWKSRENYIANREKNEREHREKRKAEDQAYIQQQNEEAQRLVDQAIAIIKSGNGKLENYNVTFYRSRYHGKAYSIINYLARKYGVKIPIKTQGWINESLATVTLKDWTCENCQYYTRKGGRGSTKVYEYVTQLAQAIRDRES